MHNPTGQMELSNGQKAKMDLNGFGFKPSASKGTLSQWKIKFQYSVSLKTMSSYWKKTRS